MALDLLGVLLALLALLLALVTLGLMISRSAMHRMMEHHEDHLRVGNLEVQIKLFARLVEQSLATRLHAPSHLEMDHLLHKLADNTITAEEVPELHRLILERSTELRLAGDDTPDLTLPRMLTLWSLEVRQAYAGQTIKGTHD